MRISDIFKQQTVSESGRAKANQNPYAKSQGSETGNEPGEDRVSISSLSKQLSQVSQIVSDDDSQRRGRVQELKAKVESGEYQIDSNSIAQSIVSFAKDDRE